MLPSHQSPPCTSGRLVEGMLFKTPKMSISKAPGGVTSVSLESRAVRSSKESSQDAMLYAVQTKSTRPTQDFYQLLYDADTTLDPSVRRVDIGSFGDLSQPATTSRNFHQNGLSFELDNDHTSARARLSDPVRHFGTNHNLSITDADKLERSRGRWPTPSTFDRHSLDEGRYNFEHNGSGYSSNFSSTYHQLGVPRSELHPVGMSAGSLGSRSEGSSDLRFTQHTSPVFLSSGSVQSRNTPIETMQRVADNIIKEKDGIIEWQKMQVELLQRGVIPDYRLDQGASLKIQSLQYENASLKAELMELIASKKCDIEAYERKLGATEYELRELKLFGDSQTKLKESAMKSLEEQVKEKDERIKELLSREKKFKHNSEKLEKEISKARHYIQDLPTSEQNEMNLKSIKKLKEDLQLAQKEINLLEKKLSDAAKGLQARDELVENVQGAVSQLNDEISSLKKQNAELEAQLSADKDLSLIKQLQFDKERLQTDCLKAKKLLEAKQLQLNQTTASLTLEVKSLKDRVVHESATVDGLQQTLSEKELQLKQAVQSLSEMTGEHQRLTEHTLSLEERLRELRLQNGADQARLERQLYNELNLCLTNLQSLVEVCTQCAKNEEPDLVALLGVRHETQNAGIETANTQRRDVLKYQLSKVRDLRLQIDQLRSVVSDKFAEEMGRRLTCSQQ